MLDNGIQTFNNYQWHNILEGIFNKRDSEGLILNSVERSDNKYIGKFYIDESDLPNVSDVQVEVAFDENYYQIKQDGNDSYLRTRRALDWAFINYKDLSLLEDNDGSYIEVVFDNEMELALGKNLKLKWVDTSGSRVRTYEYLFRLRISAKEVYEKKTLTIADEETGIKINVTARANMIPEGSELSYIKNPQQFSRNYDSPIYDQNSSVWYQCVVTYNGEVLNVKGADLNFVLPENYINSYIDVPYLSNDELLTKYYSGTESIYAHLLGNTFYVSNMELNNTAFAFLTLSESPALESLEDGIYIAKAFLCHKSSLGTYSMANAALSHDAYLIRKNNTNYIYFNAHEMVVNGVECHLAELLPAELGTGIPIDDHVKYTSFVYDNGNSQWSDGLRDNAKYDAITEYACVTGGVLTLDEKSYDSEKNAYYMSITSAVMAGMGNRTYEETVTENEAGRGLHVWLTFTDIEKCNDFVTLETIIDEGYGYQSTALLRAIKRAQSEKLYDPDIYTTESYNNLMTAVDLAQTVYEGTFSDTVTASNAHEEQINLVQAAIDAFVVERIGDKTALTALVESAKTINASEYTNASYNALKEAVASAESVLAVANVKQSKLDEQAAALQAAIDALEKKPQTTLDKDNLADGTYTVYADMIKTDRVSKSMSDNAIEHTVKLDVINGEYFVTVEFKGLSIFNQFGYLKNLSYYDAGYTYNDYGIPQGIVVPATVLSRYDVIDQYNDADNLYPHELQFKLVDKASEEYVPLQVFVPIMEAITEGSGTQDVLMQLDWSTLQKKDADKLTNTSSLYEDTIQLGTSLTVNMGAEGGEGDYTYSVLYKKATGTKWAVAQKPTTDTAATVKPAAAGQYYVMVKVKDASGNVAKKYFVVNVENNLKNTSALSADTVKKGESVTVNAAADGTTGDYQYAVLYKKLTGTKWAVAQKYDANAEITFTPAAATEYEVCVKARDNNGAVAKKYFIVSVTK